MVEDIFGELMKKVSQVKIVIKKSKYHSSHKGGCDYASVSYSGKTYGGGSPCDNQYEIESAISKAEYTIRSNGDIPILCDERIEQITLF